MMLKQKLFTLALGLSLMGQIACGDDGKEEAEITIETYAAQLSKITCENHIRCCDAEEIAEVYEEMKRRAIKDGVQVPEVTDQATCEAAMNALNSDQRAEELNASVTSGRGEFVPAKAEACLAALSNSACADEYPAACSELLVPKVSLGGECTSTMECVEGGCSGGPLEPMTCVARQPEGAACPDWLCVDGFYCEVDPQTCVAVKADGAACISGEECQSGHCVEQTCGPRASCLGD